MNVKIYTDGAARGNPDGPGGYGTVLEYVDTKGFSTRGSFPPDTKRRRTTVWS